jgi:hypothetical protein
MLERESFQRHAMAFAEPALLFLPFPYEKRPFSGPRFSLLTRSVTRGLI